MKSAEFQAPRRGAERWDLRALSFIGCVLGLLCGVVRGGEAPIRYRIDLREPASHLVRVTMTIPQPPPATEIQFPAWNNLYQIRDFVRNVQELRAECDGKPRQLVRDALNRWRLDSGSCSEFTLRYAVYANEESVFSNILNESHAFLNFAQVCFYLPAARGCEIRVEFLLPPDWRVATMLDEGESPAEFIAADYDTLADSPAEAGKFQEYNYVQKGATYRVVVLAEEGSVRPERLLSSLAKITATATALMQDVPFSRYTFIFHFLADGAWGGMEHRNGTAIAYPADNLERNWTGLEDIVAHEFFHLWNVKRIRPQRLEPIDYIHGNDTRDLWFCEGLTSTYGLLTMLRAGLLTRESFYGRVAREIKGLQDRPARLFQSVETAGLEAWLEKYPDYSRPARSISYYNKGALLGFLLDLAIRQATHNRTSLDEVIRRLNRDFARQNRCFTSEDLGGAVAKVAPEYQEFESVERDYIRGTEELDYARFLGYAGLRLTSQAGEGTSLGFLAVQSLTGPVVVGAVEPDSSAARVGLQKGDILLRLNGRALTSLPLEGIENAGSGKLLRLQVRRAGRRLDLAFAPDAKRETTYQVEEVAHPTAEQLRVRKGWLEGKTDSAEEQD